MPTKSEIKIMLKFNPFYIKWRIFYYLRLWNSICKIFLFLTDKVLLGKFERFCTIIVQ